MFLMGELASQDIWYGPLLETFNHMLLREEKHDDLGSK